MEITFLKDKSYNLKLCYNYQFSYLTVIFFFSFKILLFPFKKDSLSVLSILIVTRTVLDLCRYCQSRQGYHDPLKFAPQTPKK